MDLSNGQKQAFEKEFITLIYDSSVEIQNEWHQKGQINWVKNEPLTSGFENEFTDDIKDRYVILYNKMLDRSISEET